MHRAVVRAWKRLTNPAETRWLRELESRAERGHRLLDVGCGVGNLLRVAAHWGYDVYGVEPGNGAQVARANGFAVQQCRFEDATFSPDSFDVVVINHVIEHLTDPGDALHRAAALLRSGGLLVVRTPVSDSMAFRLFRTFWVQLDAPRHLTIFSSRALQELLKIAGFGQIQAWRDSTGFQFVGSFIYSVHRPLAAVAHSHRRMAELLISPIVGVVNAVAMGDQVTVLATPVKA